MLQPVEWYHYIASLINPAHQLPDLKVGEMYAEVAEYTQAGNFWDFIWGNVTLGQKASLLWAVNAGRFFQTAGLFLLGFYIGRKQRLMLQMQPAGLNAIGNDNRSPCLASSDYCSECKM